MEDLYLYTLPVIILRNHSVTTNKLQFLILQIYTQIKTPAALQTAIQTVCRSSGTIPLETSAPVIKLKACVGKQQN